VKYLKEEDISMRKIKIRQILMVSTIIVILTGCTLPGFSTPTPFSFPTPDKTMTALFEPTQAVPATSAGDTDGNGSDGSDTDNGAGDDDQDQATATPKSVATSTPNLTATADTLLTLTPEVTSTDDAPDYSGPAIRGGPSIVADYMESANALDGDLAGWTPPIQKVIDEVVYGEEYHTGDADCSGTVQVGWNEDYLFLGVRVKDDKYVQEAVKEQIYLGDSIEILFDRYVSGDYYLQAMTSDDYQLGISPGQYGILTCSINPAKKASLPVPSDMEAITCSPGPPQAYLWFPKAIAGKKNEVKIGALEGGEGYQVEIWIPWTLLGVTNPQEGDHFGFAISINDNDKSGKLRQQTVVSNVPTRFFSDPTTWGDLVLRKK
jgi:hypothetical protein